MYEWLVQVNPSPDFLGDGVVIERHHGDTYDVLLRVHPGRANAILATVSRASAFTPPTPAPWRRAAIAEHVKPGPASGELARLEDARR